ncbi:MAG TPA: hypothetical protein PKD86_16470 [Gemmatales bacterium]|nr:hypothetical protein [Gemmatales bacterium]HMP60941.1 hypothetical protein [Gemmatales bacterium]
MHYVIGFFTGVALGMGIDALLDMLAGRDLDSWIHLKYQMQSVAILGGGAVSLLGLWMGWRSYGPARDAAAGLNPKPSAFLQSLLAIRQRGAIRLFQPLGEVLHARFAVLTGAAASRS